MTYTNPLDRLIQSRVVVYPPPPHYLKYLSQAVRGTNQVSDIRYCTIYPPAHDRESGIIPLDVSWVMTEEAWMLVYVEGHGDFSPNDFYCQFTTFDQLVDAVMQYYFGAPTSIEGWIVPLHRHPELPEAAVRTALAQATTIRPADFPALKATTRTQAFANTAASDWENTRRGTFLKLAHADDPQRTCYLLRNGAQAYVVAD